MTTHQHIIGCMKALGYQSNDSGVCFGLAHMAKQAVLFQAPSTAGKNGLPAFDARIAMIGQLTPNEFGLINAELKKESKDRNFDFLSAKNITMDNITDILAFFDGVELYFQKEKYPHLFLRDEDLNQENTKVLEELLSPVEVAKIGSFSGVYSHKELETLFTKLSTTLSKPLAMSLSDGDHEICIGYDPYTKTWSFIDSNQLPTQYYLQANIQALTGRLMMGFLSQNPDTVMCANLYVNKSNETLAQAQLQHCQESSDWLSIHQVSQQKCTVINSNQWTWLSLAAKHGNTNIVEALIAAKANINQADNNSATPLFIAALKGHLNIVNALITAGANINQATKNGSTPLFMAAQQGHLGIVKALITAGANINQANNDGATPLCIAAHKGHLGIVNALITAGVNINQVANNGFTPLYIATQNGHLEIVKALIAAGANINQANNNSATPLFIAAQKGHLGIVKTLITAGANINQANNDGATPLCIAAHKGHLDIVNALITAGANINQATKDGATPLFIATHQGHLDIVNVLIKAEADINQANNNGATPLYIATQKRHSAIVEALTNAATLKSKSVSENHFDTDGDANTPGEIKTHPRDSSCHLISNSPPLLTERIAARSTEGNLEETSALSAQKRKGPSL